MLLLLLLLLLFCCCCCFCCCCYYCCCCSFTSVLEAKASKDIQSGLYWKITWPPLIYTSALKIDPQVVRRYSAGFVKCFDISVFCFILNKSSQLQIKTKITIFFTVVNIFFKAINFRFWQVTQSLDFIYVVHSYFGPAIFQLYTLVIRVVIMCKHFYVNLRPTTERC